MADSWYAPCSQKRTCTLMETNTARLQHTPALIAKAVVALAALHVVAHKVAAPSAACCGLWGLVQGEGGSSG